MLLWNKQTAKCTVYVWGSWRCTRMILKAHHVSMLYMYVDSLYCPAHVLMRVFFYCSSILEVVFSVVGHVLIGMLQSKRAILVMPGTLLKLNRERAWNVVLHTWWPHTLPEMLTFMHMWLIGSSHSRDTHAWCQHNCPNQRLKSVLIITHQQPLQWLSNVLLMTKLMASVQLKECSGFSKSNAQSKMPCHNISMSLRFSKKPCELQ